MNVKFNKQNWKISDILYLFQIINTENYEEKLFEIHGITMNKEVVKLVDKCRKYTDSDNRAIKLLVKDETQTIFTKVLSKTLFELDDLEKLPEILRSLDENKIRRKAVEALLEGDEEITEENKNSINFGKVTESVEEMMSFVDMLSIPDENKWSIFEFMKKPQEFFSELADITEKVIPTYLKLISKHEKKIEKFNEYIQEQIDIHGDKIFGDIVEDLVEYTNKKQINIISSFVNSKSLIMNIEDEEVYLYVGFEFRESIEKIRGKNEQENILNIVSTMTDPMKFKIMCCMNEKEVYGKEICEATGLSKAALSYHIAQLINMGLIKFNKRGNKTFYILKKELIHDSIDKLKKYF